MADHNQLTTSISLNIKHNLQSFTLVLAIDRQRQLGFFFFTNVKRNLLRNDRRGMFCLRNSSRVAHNVACSTCRASSGDKTISQTKKSEPTVPVDLAYASYESTDVGRGPPPLVIMHGLLGSKGNWNSLSKLLHKNTRPQRKIIAVDARNHGDSPHSPLHSYEHLAEDTRQLMRRLKIDKAALLGHSMGGRAMMLFSLKYPELVDRMIVADISPVRTSPNLKTMPSLFDALNRVALPTKVPISTARVAADHQLLKVVANKGLRSFLLTNLVQRNDGSYAWRLNLSALAKNFHYIAVFPETGGLTYDGPVLFVGGGASDFIQKTDHPQITKLFPNARFEYIEGAGHWVHSEKPAEFLQLCLDFLNKDVTL